MSISKQPIVVPVDFSGEEKRSIAIARELCPDPAGLHLIHVLESLDTISPGAVWGEVTDGSRKSAVNKKLAQLASDERADGANLVVRFGNPGLAIADYAEEISAEMIVVPSHGYHGARRLFLGSVAERIIRHARCSVLVLRRSDAQ